MEKVVFQKTRKSKIVKEIKILKDKTENLIKEYRQKEKLYIKDATELKCICNDLERKNEVFSREFIGLFQVGHELRKSGDEFEVANEKLKKLDKVKTDFVSTVAHELRTPLAVIKEGVSLILEKVSGDINDKQQEILSMTKTNVDRLGRIINDLLDISRIEAGRMDLKLEQIDFTKLVKEAYTRWKLESDKKDQNFTISVPSYSVNLHADADKMNQILNNLISNAVKYTPTKGYIEINLKDLKDEIVVSVKDRGYGIDKEDLPKLFEKFQRFGSHVQSGSKGTGLGLAITKELVDMHHGKIEVETKLNKGSTFALRLPKATREKYLSYLIEDVAKRRGNMSLINVKVLNFSSVKEKHGLELSRDFLKSIERKLGGVLRRGVNTFIGEDGSILITLVDTSKSDVVNVKERIQKAIDEFLKSCEPASLQHTKIVLGVATYPDDAETSEELLKEGKRLIKI